MTNPKVFPVVGPGVEMPPNYERAVCALTDEELEEEILRRRGERGYQLALLAEADRRGAAPPPEPKPARASGFDASDWERT